jgi:hypothetical protein
MDDCGANLNNPAQNPHANSTKRFCIFVNKTISLIKSIVDPHKR